MSQPIENDESTFFQIEENGHDKLKISNDGQQQTRTNDTREKVTLNQDDLTLSQFSENVASLNDYFPQDSFEPNTSSCSIDQKHDIVVSNPTIRNILDSSQPIYNADCSINKNSVVNHNILPVNTINQYHQNIQPRQNLSTYPSQQLINGNNNMVRQNHQYRMHQNENLNMGYNGQKNYYNRNPQPNQTIVNNYNPNQNSMRYTNQQMYLAHQSAQQQKYLQQNSHGQNMIPPPGQRMRTNISGQMTRSGSDMCRSMRPVTRVEPVPYNYSTSALINEMNVLIKELDYYKDSSNLTDNDKILINNKHQRVNQIRRILNAISKPKVYQARTAQPYLQRNAQVGSQQIRRVMSQGNVCTNSPINGQQRFNIGELPADQQRYIMNSINQAHYKSGQRGQVKSVVVVRTPQANGLPPKQQIIVQQVLRHPQIVARQGNSYPMVPRIIRPVKENVDSVNKEIEGVLENSGIFNDSNDTAVAQSYNDMGSNSKPRYSESRPTYAKRKYTRVKKQDSVANENLNNLKRFKRKKRKDSASDYDQGSDYDLPSEIEEYEERSIKKETDSCPILHSQLSIPTRKSSRNTSRKRYVDVDIDELLQEEQYIPKKTLKTCQSDPKDVKVDLDKISNSIENKLNDLNVTQSQPMDENSNEASINTCSQASAVAVINTNIPENFDTTMTIEKILADKPNPIFDEADNNVKSTPLTDIVYFVKYRHFSYMHCQWKTEQELLNLDRKIKQKIKRYFAKKKLQYGSFMNAYETAHETGIYFNPNYLIVDRILDNSNNYETGKNKGTDTDVKEHYFLVKWQSLPYSAATWEIEEEVPKLKIEQYRTIVNLKQVATKIIKRPPPPLSVSHRWRTINGDRIYNNENKLRYYQVEGVNWLSYNYYHRQPCILADEMGLGKTVQSISFLNEIFEYGIRGPFLIIVPLSTLSNWYREFEDWTDMNAIVYHGSSECRKMIKKYEFYYKNDDGEPIENAFRCNAIITTYEIVISDMDVLSAIYWRCAVIDEAHRLKNRNSRLLLTLKNYTVEHKILLTGTPLQNNVGELFSLLNFLEPERFNHLPMFLADFGDLKTIEQVTKLKAILKPMMLRRLKEDVEKSLAPKEETIIEVELTNIQKKYYRAIIENNFSFVTNKSAASLPSLVNTMMELRKCCNHPFLIKGAEDEILLNTRKRMLENDENFSNVDIFYDSVVKSCGKLVLIDKLLPRLKQNNHRVLIFSQMIRVLDILEDYFINRGYMYERLDGRIHGSARQDSIDRFNVEGSNKFAFLLCTRAGGLGINLTAADTVIIYDSDWNPQNDLQAQARCHRIGQTKSVKIYRLITRNTYEREMFDKASLKLGLDKAVLHDSVNMDDVHNTKQTSSAKPAMSKSDVEKLLRKGAYAAVMNDDGLDDTFCEEDIDHILERRTTTVKVGQEQVGSTFSKASFSASYNRTDIDIDDPNFWDKWSKKVNYDHPDPIDNLIVMKPRTRKQNQKFDESDDSAEYKDPKDKSTTLPTEKRKSNRNKKIKKKVEKYEESEGSEKSDKEAEENFPIVIFKKKGRHSMKEKKTKKKCSHGDAVEYRVCSKQGYDSKTCCCIYSRKYCFMIERKLMKYGWSEFDRLFSLLLNELPVIFENFTVDILKLQAKAIIMFSLKHFVGDSNIKTFLYDLVNENVDACDGELEPDSDKKDVYNFGLLNPIPRGRRSKRSKEAAEKLTEAVFLPDDEYILDESFKNHVKRHSQKFLFRIRLMYYLKVEVLGSVVDCCSLILNNAKAQDVDLNLCDELVNVSGEMPDWWSKECDKSLLIGVYKHGFENYSDMLKDECLFFHTICNSQESQAKMHTSNDGDSDNTDKEYADDEETIEDEVVSVKLAPVTNCKNVPEQYTFPTKRKLTVRFRRLITRFQRWKKKSQMDQEKKAKLMEKKMKLVEIMAEKEKQRSLLNQRWSVREQTDFLKILNHYGVDYVQNGEDNSQNDEICWDIFKLKAKLDKKSDQLCTKFLNDFYLYCEDLISKSSQPSSFLLDNNLYIDKNDKSLDFDAKLVDIKPPSIEENGSSFEKSGNEEKLYTPFPVLISADRAFKIYYRSKMVTNIRCNVLRHENLLKNLKRCENNDNLPDWWIPGIVHDLDLLKGISSHGLDKLENLLFDQSLGFLRILEPHLTDEMKKNLKENCSTDEKQSFSNFSKLTNAYKKQINLTKESVDDLDKDKKISSDENSNLNDVSCEKTDDFSIIQWPKSRILLTRVKNLCNLVETGFWNKVKVKKSAQGSNCDETLLFQASTITVDNVVKRSTMEKEKIDNFEKVAGSIKSLSEFHMNLLESIYFLNGITRSIKTIFETLRDNIGYITSSTNLHRVVSFLEISEDTLVPLTSIVNFDTQSFTKLSNVVSVLKENPDYFIDPLNRKYLTTTTFNNGEAVIDTKKNIIIPTTISVNENVDGYMMMKQIVPCISTITDNLTKENPSVDINVLMAYTKLDKGLKKLFVR